MEIKRRTLEGIQRTQKQNHKSTGTCSTEERRKIEDKNRCIRTYN